MAPCSTRFRFYWYFLCVINLIVFPEHFPSLSNGYYIFNVPRGGKTEEITRQRQLNELFIALSEEIRCLLQEHTAGFRVNTRVISWEKLTQTWINKLVDTLKICWSSDCKHAPFLMKQLTSFISKETLFKVEESSQSIKHYVSLIIKKEGYKNDMDVRAELLFRSSYEQFSVLILVSFQFI